jgi:hypothetical protein
MTECCQHNSAATPSHKPSENKTPATRILKKINPTQLKGNQITYHYSFSTKTFYTEVYTANNWHHLLPYKTSRNPGSHHQEGSNNPLFGDFSMNYGGSWRAFFFAFCRKKMLTQRPSALQDGDVKG